MILFNLPQLFQEQREANKRQKSQQVINVPQFYFPFGKPVAAEENEAVLKRLTEVFKTLPDQKAERSDMDKVTQVHKDISHRNLSLTLATCTL